jgi:hypothetical protein
VIVYEFCQFTRLRAELKFRCEENRYAMTLLKAEQAAVSADEAKSIAVDAYVYGYSLITTEVTRVQMSNVPKRG